MKCIFGSDNQWATINKIDQQGLKKLIDYEHLFGVTIHRKYSIPERIKKGSVYDAVYQNKEALTEGLSKTFKSSIFMNDWILPAGAFGENNGPI